MNKMKILTRLLPIILIVFLVSCAGQNGFQIKKWSDMEPKERAIWFNSRYKEQFQDYAQQITLEELTQQELDQVASAPGLMIQYKLKPLPDKLANYLLTKKKILAELYPFLKAYNEYLATGTIPSYDLEQQIIKLIDKLVLDQIMEGVE